MTQWNGQHLELGIVLGQIVEKSSTQIRIAEAQTDIMRDQDESLRAILELLQHREDESHNAPLPVSTGLMQVRELMQAVPPILSALVPLLALALLAAGRVGWEDIRHLVGFGG